ncbi:MAG: N-6 DNA methylase, partial [Thermodesulfovibrionales bacterium]|nr:N-6 DNA methylase [Thermodesulfovibrionales bacterium]
IQQAVRSCKVGGKICLVLPEGFFSNSQDEILRKYVAKHCKILAIVSLPRGVFKKGTSTKTIKSGSQSSPQKMSILYAEKTCPVIDGAGIEIDDNEIGYPVFLANISPPESTAGDVCEWLEPRLNIVLEEWKKWQTENHLSALDESLLTDAYESSNITQAKKKLSKKDDRQISLLLEEPVQTKKPKPVKSEVSISKTLDGLFKKK